MAKSKNEMVQFIVDDIKQIIAEMYYDWGHLLVIVQDKKDAGIVSKMLGEHGVNARILDDKNTLERISYLEESDSTERYAQIDLLNEIKICFEDKIERESLKGLICNLLGADYLFGKFDDAEEPYYYIDELTSLEQLANYIYNTIILTVENNISPKYANFLLASYIQLAYSCFDNEYTDAIVLAECFVNLISFDSWLDADLDKIRLNVICPHVSVASFDAIQEYRHWDIRKLDVKMYVLNMDKDELRVAELLDNLNNIKKIANIDNDGEVTVFI
jgi:hypothetical protein